MISRHEVAAGDHGVELDVKAVVPTSVELDTELWARTIDVSVNSDALT